ncbi:MAG: hypothetical protein COB53_06020 [Elusimicrobia bacterium]|nr:MAG: hypothetical protein COB53_06020 [Elusimicrobiota bacterium]
MMKPWSLLLVVFFALLGGCRELTLEEQAELNIPPQNRVPPKYLRTEAGKPSSVELSTTDPVILNALFELLEKSDKIGAKVSKLEGSAFEELLSVGSPNAYLLRNRYLNPGVMLALALAEDPDPALRSRLVEYARWERSMDVRSTALTALARMQNLEDERSLHEAMSHLNPIVRFGGMEALGNWGKPEKAIPLLKLAAENDRQRVLRVYAAGMMARLGNSEGRDKLRGFLNDTDWVVHAMAARYLGDYGEAGDYDVFLRRLDAQNTNDFVLAEYAVASLKLFKKKSAPKPEPQSDSDFGLGFILAPITVTAPRVDAPFGISSKINNVLLRLLESRSEVRPDDLGVINDASRVFANLTTLTGHMMRLRYTELGFLLTEGLAGVKDFSLQSELQTVARTAKNPQMRAAALVSLGYTKEEQFVSLFRETINDQNLTVRLGAFEALVVSQSQQALFIVGDKAQNDQSLSVRVMAAAAYWKMGNPSGRNMLLEFAENEDWYVRAHAVSYLGELGDGQDYRYLLDRLSRDTDDIVRSELVLALMRLREKK